VAGGVDDVDAMADVEEGFIEFFLAGFGVFLGPVQVTAAEVMVMPRSRSCSIQSVTVLPSSTSPDFVDEAGIKEDAFGRSGFAGIDMAAMPILRIRSSV